MTKDKKPEVTYWSALDLMDRLGYKDFDSIRELVGEAVEIMIDLNIPYYENIIHEKQDGRDDFKLSRFACWLIVMSADTKKDAVKSARVKLTGQVSRFGLTESQFEALERLPLRTAYSIASKDLSSAAARHGVTDFSTFSDAGYQGLYAMHKPQLLGRRNLSRKVRVQDFMGKTELEANLLLLSLTRDKINNFGYHGQHTLERVHHEVGVEIRNLLKGSTGKFPEELKVETEIHDIKKQMRAGYQAMKKSERNLLGGDNVEIS